MPPSLKDPVPAGPFLAWFDRQLELARREGDAWPTVTGSRRGRSRNGDRGELEYVLTRIGWPVESGSRRIYRWRHENTGMVERAVVEDALWRAGVFFEDVYDTETEVAA
jgi:hypothetical protein